MHNKYIVIDNHIVITGSYNYTYLAENINNENVIRLSGAEDIINGFIDDFNEISSNLSSVLSVKEYLEENPPFTNVFAFSNYGIKDIYQQAIILQKNDNDEEAKELVDYIDSSSDFSEKDCNNYQIRNVIYRQWQRDNFADKIIVKNNLIFVKFRTIASGGCWICSPGTKRCWMLRDSMNKSSYLSPTKIKNICINNKTIIEEAKNGCIYYLDKDDKEDFSNNDCGYKVNEDKKMIDDNGNKVPVEFIKIEGKVEMTCEVYFEDNERAFSDKIVDFIEGKDCENKDNFWHCFEINLRLNREPLDY